MADAIERLPGSGIVYVLTVAEAERLAAFLRSLVHAVEAYSGQIDAERRLQVEEQLRHNQIKAVVATSALGMGYDKPDLGFCVHIGSPASPVAYYQQVGRAGRGVAHAEGVLLPSEADERIWDYFATATIPDEVHAHKVLEALTTEALSLLEIEARTGVRRGRLEALLKILAVEGVVDKDGSAWRASGQAYVHDSAKWSALIEVRKQEAELMRRYARGQGCLMAYLQTALDDPAPKPCGRCSVCTGRLPEPGASPSQDKQNAARQFLRGIDIEIEPRKLWPGGGKRKGPIKGFAQGRAVAFADDPAWAESLQAWRQSGELPQALLDGAVATLARWSKQWPARPTCVVPLAAPHMAANRSLASFIAHKGRLPLLDVLSWQGGPAPSDSASAAVVEHLQSVMQLAPGAALPAGPVLLVACEVRSRWSASLAASLLREHGAAQVLLLGLHQLA
jgi:ATP-dependent DNA helicase RecQ